MEELKRLRRRSPWKRPRREREKWAIESRPESEERTERVLTMGSGRTESKTKPDLPGL